MSSAHGTDGNGNGSGPGADRNSPLSPGRQGALLLEAGSGLQYRLREPRTAPARHLVVLVHGVEQNETTLAALGLALPADLLVAWVRGPLTFAPGRHGFFNVRFTPEGPVIVPDEAEASRVQLIEFVANLGAAYGIGPDARLIAGFSQGGIMSNCVALTAPETVAGFGMLGARILPELQPQIVAPERLARLNAFVAHGAADTKLALSWAQRAQQQLTALAVRHELHVYPCGHEVAPPMAADFVRWVGQTLSAA